MNHPQYHYEIILDDDRFAGILLWWSFPDMRYVEHIAVMPSLRGHGLGREVLNLFLRESDIPVFLEVEIPDKDIKHRRIKFYERLGFVLNKHAYFQPSYHVGGEPVPLLIMTYPCEIPESGIQQIYLRYHPVIHALTLYGNIK